jgi:hypothetical protein
MGLLSSLFRKSKKKIHGHELIQRHENRIMEYLQSVEEQTYIYEVGSQREAGSTLYLSQLAQTCKSLFFTLDLNEETTKQARKIVKSVNPKFDAINGFGEELLKEVDHPIHLLYLDAFDIEGDWHPSELKDWYSNKGVNLDNENCWKMHKECIQNTLSNLPVNSFVAFDDVNPVDQDQNLILDKVDPDHKEWSGKGHTAIPFMLENGFSLVDNQRSAALFQRIK